MSAAVLANRALARQVQQQAYQLESTRRALAGNIVLAAINAASLQQQVAATEQLVALGEQRARQMAARYRLGSASHDDMLAAEQDAALHREARFTAGVEYIARVLECDPKTAQDRD